MSIFATTTGEVTLPILPEAQEPDGFPDFRSSADAGATAADAH